MQRLPVGSGHEAGEFDERLVVLSGQEQPNEALGSARRSSNRPNRSSKEAQNWSIASVVGGVGFRGRRSA
jgi:hypothetical protein